MANLTKQEASVLAGMFAVTNMGQRCPSKELILRAKRSGLNDANSIACMFAVEYMETVADEKAWTQETRYWQRELSKMTMEKVAEIWPDNAKAYAEAVAANA